jgi:hypothetical protein
MTDEWLHAMLRLHIPNPSSNVEEALGLTFVGIEY